MDFKQWLGEEARVDFLKGTIPLWLSHLFENEDYRSQGYKRLQSIKFGPHKGKPGWWNPQTGHLVSDGGESPQPQQSLSGQIQQQRQQSQQPQQKAPQQQPQQSTRPKDPNEFDINRHWVLARAIRADEDLGIEEGQLVAMAKQDEAHWKFVTLDRDEGKLVNLGAVPVTELQGLLKKELNAKGKIVFAERPSQLLRMSMPKKKKKGECEMLSPEDMTEEGLAIEQRFEQMMAHPGPSHMVIDALAGSGKTTMLVHLACKYGKAGQQWLYLVFNSRNRYEAQGKFPKNYVDVETTNSFAGKVLDSNGQSVQKTERMVDRSDDEKINLVQDGSLYESLLNEMHIPNPHFDDGHDKGFSWILKAVKKAFNFQTKKLAELAKAYAGDPRNTESLDNLVDEILGEHDIDVYLEDVKEMVEKHYKSYRYLPLLNDIMGVESFLKVDFTPYIKQAAIWLLVQTMPHAIDQTFSGDEISRAEQRRKRIPKGRVKQIDLNLKEYRDFTDDLWYAAIHADEIDWNKYKKFDVIMLDEVQDFNEAKRIIVQKLNESNPQAKIVAVGDPNQAIYRFTGADAEAFEKLTGNLGDWSTDEGGDVRKTLSKNFRSRQAIIDAVNRKTIMQDRPEEERLKRGREFKTEGNVTDYEKTYDDAFDELKKEFNHMGEVKETAFIARTNEPLVHAALRLLGEGIPFILLGKDIAGDLLQYVTRVTNASNVFPNDDIDKLEQAVTNYHEEKKQAWFGSAAKASNLQQVEELTNALSAAISKMKQEKGVDDEDDYDDYGYDDEESGITVKEFRSWLYKQLGGVNVENEKDLKELEKKREEQNPVILTTSHKSKGFEFDRVFVLRDDLFPHPRAKLEKDKKQEENNRYVAYTRAKDELHILEPEGQPGYKPKEAKGEGEANGNI